MAGGLLGSRPLSNLSQIREDERIEAAIARLAMEGNERFRHATVISLQQSPASASNVGCPRDSPKPGGLLDALRG